MMRQLTIVAVAILTVLPLSTDSASAQALPSLDTRPLDKALEQYWSPTQDVDAIKKRNNIRGGRHEFSIYSGVVPNDSFFSYVPIGLRWNFYPIDDVGLEVFGGYWAQLDSELKDFLEENDLYDLLTPQPKALLFCAMANLVWTPFHGKIAIMTEKMVHFDFNLTGGVGVMGSQTYNPTTEETDLNVDFGGNLGLGVRLIIFDWFSIRLDYRQFIYPGPDDDTAFPAEFSLSVGFWTS